jgi:hypothetical protein
LRVLEDRLRVRQLDDLAEVHHRDAVTHLADDGHVVADEQDREIELLLDVLQQRDHVRLDGDVQRRHRLVGDDHPRVDDQRPGERDPLFLATRQLVWVPVSVVRVESDAVQQVTCDLLAATPWSDAVDLQRLRDRLPDGHPGVKAGVGVLEDHLCLPSEPLQLLVVEGGDVLVVEQDGAVRRLLQPEDRLRRRRLSTAGLADEPDRLTAVDGKGDAVDRADTGDLAVEQPLCDREVFLQVPHLQQCLAHCRSPPSARVDCWSPTPRSSITPASCSGP